jgi:hypothetical protein
MATLLGTEVEGIEKRWALFKDVPKIIDEKFEDGREYAQDALRTATETIHRLEEIATELQNIDVDISIEDIVAPDIDDFVGTVPTTPTISLNMPDDLVDIQEIERAVHDKMLHDLNEGGPAIPEDVEDAIFKRESERGALLLDDTIDKIRDEWSKSGFTLPNGMLMANISQAVIEYNNKRADVSRDIAIKSFELSDQNTRFIVEKGLQWYATRIEGYKAKVQAEIARVDAVVRTFLGEVEVYKGTAQVYTALVDVKIKKFDAQVRAALARAELIIKDAEIDMKNYEILNNLKIEAMKAIGSINAQVVAGALSSVSAAAHISASDSGSYIYDTNPSY